MQGAHLGPYRIDRELGVGGMGKVYAATGPDGAVVALKVVHPHLLETPGFFKRFMREAQLGQSIRHENVVRTLDCDQDFSGGKPQCFLVMEYVEGQTLTELLRELERVPEELCRHVAQEICEGLAAVHEAGVVHRDLKPDNVLITPEHVVKVMDLGVAQVADEALRLSRDGEFVGSVEYAAPEQFKGGDVDGRTDLHALGVLLYELSSGQHPFRAGGFHETMQRVCESEPRRLGEINPQLSAFFEEVVHTLLVKAPRGRFASATQLLDVLHEGEDSAWWRERARKVQADTRRPLRRIRIPRETAVYGREDELATLRALYDRARAGDGQVVLIEGEAGIGKSRLVDELIARLQSDGEDLSFLFGSYPPGGAATTEGAFSSAFREQLGEAGSAAYLPENQILVPAFDALLRGEGAPEGAQPLTPASLQTCFVRATQALGSERVTVVLIDDLHFAPEEGRALFSSLAMAMPGHRVLLIASTRPGASEQWRAGLTRLPQVTLLPVQRLGPKDLVRLLADSLGSKHLAEDLAGRIAVKSDGNPFFAFEIIRGLREGQFITQKDDGTWASTRVIDDIRIPSSVLDLVNARVSGLSQEERDVLDVACCWGHEFDPALISEVTGIARIPLYKQLAQIERAHRLVRSAGRHFVFDHHQVQEALYSSLPEVLREEYHAALAEALETRTRAAENDPKDLDGALCVDLCEHYLKGARGESALRYLEPAQKHLLKGYLNAQVFALTERALAVPELLTGTERAKTLLRLTGALRSLGRWARREECAREAERLAEAAGDDELRIVAANMLGEVLAHTSRHREAEAAFRCVLDLARARGDRSSEAGAMGRLGNLFEAEGRLAEAQEHHERSLALSREIGYRHGEAQAKLSLGNVFWSQGRIAEAQEHYERALAALREIGDRHGEAVVTGNLGNVCYSQGRLTEAQAHHERHLAIHREIGFRQGEAIATGNLGVVSYAQGRLAEAQEYWERDLALTREIGNRQGEAIATGNLGLVFHAQGRLAEAKEYDERHLALSREIGYREGEVYAQSNLGGVLRDEGETARSEAHLEQGLAVCAEIGNRLMEAWIRLALGSLRAARSREQGGVGEGVREQLAAARDLAREAGRRDIETLARGELALLPDGDAADALAAYAEHEERLGAGERREVRLLHFKATGDRAHLDAAKRLLDEALSTVHVEYRESMCRNRRVDREILAAWREEFGDDAPDGDEPDTDGSVTRVAPAG